MLFFQKVYLDFKVYPIKLGIICNGSVKILGTDGIDDQKQQRQMLGNRACLCQLFLSFFLPLFSNMGNFALTGAVFWECQAQ